MTDGPKERVNNPVQCTVFRDTLEDLIYMVSSKLKQKETSHKIWNELLVPFLSYGRPYIQLIIGFASMVLILLIASVVLLFVNLSLLKDFMSAKKL